MSDRWKLKKLGVPLNSVKSLKPAARRVLFMLAITTVNELLDRMVTNRDDIAAFIDNLEEVELECNSLASRREEIGQIDLSFGGLDG